jgi:Protein of unknown function (DUF4197)
MKTFLAAMILWVSLSLSGADLLDQLGLRKKSTNQTVALSGALSNLSQDQMVQGLKEALSKGVQRAVSQLGHDDGFLTNLNVKIPMPAKLVSVEKTLRTLKQDKLADDFVNTMNHAAEQAVPEAASIFGDAIKQMSIADATAILTGTNNAATEYFRKVTQTNLFGKFLPIVKTATDKVGVTSAYKQMFSKVSGSESLGGLLGSSGLLKPEDFDVDSYVTHKAMDGLFKMVAEEEKRIRQNPVARTSDLLQKVFGAVAN